MKKYDTTICLPCRNEMFLKQTVDDLIKNIRGNTEIIIGLDGSWADPGVEDRENITIIYYPESIGQRQITNQCVKLAKGKYIIKTDGHCTFDEGFDVKMLEAFDKTGDNVVIIPVMRNLHSFDWICPDGHRRYQGPSGPCLECGKPTTRDILFIAKKSPQSKSYSFDPEPHFQYFGEYPKRDKFKEDIKKNGLTESMSLQGSFFMLTKEKYYELDIDNESWGSWGSQGLQVAISFWLSGGKVIINNNTWYSHLFRTQGGDFGFPYKQSGNQVQHAKRYAKKIFFEERWPKAIRPVSWLVERFWPVTYWKDEDLKNLKETEKKVWPTRGIVYYTCNTAPIRIAKAVQKQLLKISKDKNIPIVSVSLKPMPTFGQNIHLKEKRGILTMFKQILVGLESSTADIVYLTEHDCLYPQDHYDFYPIEKDTFYYNLNVVKVNTETGMTLKVDVCKQVSGICVYRETAIKHYRERIKYVEQNGYDRNIGYEPGTHGRIKWENDFKSGEYESETPILDIRHSGNLTPNRWKQEQFRDKSNCKGWKEGNISEIEGWDIKLLETIINN